MHLDLTFGGKRLSPKTTKYLVVRTSMLCSASYIASAAAYKDSQISVSFFHGHPICLPSVLHRNKPN
jgi:hypothetical protein